MKLWALLLFCVPLFAFGQDGAPAASCGMKIALSAATHLRLTLQVKGDIRLRGLAIEMDGHPLRLALTTYIYGPGHELLLTRLLSEYPEAARLKRVWGGEMLFRDGVLVRANHTSGFLFQSPYANDPDVLAKYLASSQAKIRFSNALVIEKYDPTRRFWTKLRWIGPFGFFPFIATRRLTISFV